MKHLSLAALSAISVFLFLTIATPPPVISQKPVPPAVLNGRRIFNQSCVACHDTLGTTTKSGPALKGFYRQLPRPSDTSVRLVIQKGKRSMPGFSTLNRPQIDDLIAFLKTL
jgi:mono/diheme cytochrome c family protein